jgi:hypothetical protein
MGIECEKDLFRKLSMPIGLKTERSVYNRRRRKLSNEPNRICLKLSCEFNEFENYFVVDSMPSEVCKLSRSSRSKICKEDIHAFPDKGYFVAQSACSVEGIFQSIDLSPASVHDINCLKDIKMRISDCTLIGDRGYL